ncbi:MAG: serine acetyltransferase [Pseudomonadota bacterium]
MAPISAQKPEWAREAPRRFWDPGRKLLKAIRDYQRVIDTTGPLQRIRLKFIALRHRFWSVITQCDIPVTCKIGGGLLLPHPTGIVIHPDAVIGPNCLLMHQTTLGSVAGAAELPVLGGHVDVGPGAKILGPVTLGDHAVVGANAVVVRAVAACEIVGGVPAKPIGRNTAYESPLKIRA